MRRIKRGNVRFLSLCKRGVTGLSTIYKSAGGQNLRLEVLTKELDGFEEKGELAVIAYAPELRDGEGDVASVEVVKQMAHDWMRNGAKIDLEHDGRALSPDEAYAAESLIVQKGDPRFRGIKHQGKEIDPTGCWGAILKIESPDLRELYGSGEWDGVSIGGTALMAIGKGRGEDQASLAEKIVAQLAERLRGEARETDSEEVDVKKEELQEILKSDREELATSVATAVVEALSKADGKPKKGKPKASREEPEDEASEGLEEAPVFKGDKSDPDAVAEHLERVKAHNLAKAVDFSDPKELENYLGSLRKAKGKPKGRGREDGEADDNESESAELLEARREARAAQQRLAKAEKGLTRRGAREEGEDEDDEPAGRSSLSKSVKAGSRMAAYINQSRGHKADD